MIDTLEKCFDTAFAASNSVVKLRELILTLAMQGKLLQQDPNDQTARELLEDLQVARQSLVKLKNLKKNKSFSEITAQETPYNLPSSWQWCRWNDVAFKIGDIDHKMPSEVVEGIPYVSPRDFFGQNEINFEQAKKVSYEDFERLRLKIQPEKFDIIFPRYGTLGVNRFVLVDIDFLASYSCAVIKNFQEFIDPKYSYYYSISPLVRAEIERYKKTTTQANVGLTSIQCFLYPLPPLEEQHRIVAKIDQLMARCDELEKLRVARDRIQITVHRVACDRLLTAKDPDTFAQSWQFITQHFNELYSVKENVTELRKAILQLAVMGKLVPQDINDSPASELLKAVKEKKRVLIEKKKIKKEKPLPKISLEEVPSQLPMKWEWVRFFDVNTVKSELVSAIEYPFNHQIAPDSIEKNSGRLLGHRTVAESGATGPNNKFYEGQILYSKIRPSLNKAVIAPYDGLCSADMYPIITHVDKDFMLKVILSEPFLEQVRQAENRVKMPKLNLNSLGQFLIPLPPLNEQHRIVAKVNQLMTLCDQLEQQIDQSTQTQTALLNAVINQI